MKNRLLPLSCIMRFTSTIVVFLCVSIRILPGQTHIANPQNWTHFTINNGLPTNAISQVLEDAHGRLLVVTVTEGIYWYDGIQFQPHAANSELPTLFIKRVLLDRQGRLWILCNYEGIWIYDNGRLFPFAHNDAFDKQHFAGSTFDRLGRLWVDVNRIGLFLCDSSGCTNLTKEYNLPQGDIFQIHFDEHEQALLLYVDHGLKQLTLSQKDSRLTSLDQFGTDLTYLMPSRSGAMWTGSPSMIQLFVDDSRRIIKQLSQKGVISDRYWFLSDQQSRVWFYFSDSVFCFDKGQTSGYAYAGAEWASPFQDRFGNLWFASDVGLLKYTNTPIESWPLPALADSVNLGIQSTTNGFMFRDSRGGLWFSDYTRNVYRFNEGEVSVFAPGQNKKNLHITSVAEDRDGVLYLGTSHDGIFSWREGDSLRQVISPAALPGGYVNKLFLDSTGLLWIGSISPLPQFSYAKIGWMFGYLKKEHEDFRLKDVATFYVDANDTTWLGTNTSFSGIFIMTPAGVSALATPENFATDLFWQSNLLRDGQHLWLTSRAGVVNYNLATSTHAVFTVPELISQALEERDFHGFNWLTGHFDQTNSLYSVAKYRHLQREPSIQIYNVSAILDNVNGGVLVGSYSAGLFWLAETSARRYGKRDGLPSSKVSALWRGKDNRIWIGTLDQGAFVFENGAFSQRREIGKGITCFFEDSASGFWVGTLADGLVRIHQDRLSRYTLDNPPQAVIAIALSKNKDISIFRGDRSFARLEGNELVRLPFFALASDPDLRSAFQRTPVNYPYHYIDHRRLISGGIACWDGMTLVNYSVDEGLPGHEITDIVETAAGQLWVATHNTGIARFDGEQFVHHHGINGATLPRLVKATACGDSALWLLSNGEGMARVAGDSTKIWRGDETSLVKIHSSDMQPFHDRLLVAGPTGFYFQDNDWFTEVPGLARGKDGAKNAHYFCVDGDDLYFITSDRKLHHFRFRRMPPVISLKTLQLGDRSYDPGNNRAPIPLGFDESVFAVEFSGYHSSFPANSITYSTRLHINDRPGKWTAFDATNRVIRTDLEPGNAYRFQVRAQSPDGSISETPAEFAIVVAETPFYLRAWFWAVVALAIVGGVVAYFVARERKLNALIRRRHINPYIAGEPIFEPNLFFGREDVLLKVLSILHNNSVMLVGERRIGKTSLLIQIKRELESSTDVRYSFQPVYIDLQGVGEWEFFRSMMHDIIEQCTLGDESRNFRIAANPESYSYRDFGWDLRRIIRHLNAHVQQQLKIVLLIDEVDVMNKYDQIVHAQLRRIFMQDFSINFAAVLAGTNYIRDWNRPESPWWNLFTLIEVKPIPETAARMLVTQPVKGIFKFNDDAVTAIVQAARFKPYLIQRICIEAVNFVLDRNRRRIRKEDVEAALNRCEQLGTLV